MVIAFITGFVGAFAGALAGAAVAIRYFTRQATEQVSQPASAPVERTYSRSEFTIIDRTCPSPQLEVGEAGWTFPRFFAKSGYTTGVPSTTYVHATPSSSGDILLGRTPTGLVVIEGPAAIAARVAGHRHAA